MPRTVTLDDELEESLRWFRTWRARMLERGARLTPEQSIEDAGLDDARFMMQEHALATALQLAAELGDEEAAATWQEMLAESAR